MGEGSGREGKGGEGRGGEEKGRPPSVVQHTLSFQLLYKSLGPYNIALRYHAGM
jgi:hypothetical protein